MTKIDTSHFQPGVRAWFCDEITIRLFFMKSAMLQTISLRTCQIKGGRQLFRLWKRSVGIREKSFISQSCL